MSTITIQDLTEQEKLVLDAVLEFLDQNRPFNISEAVPFIISRFQFADININNIGIKEILKSLIKKNYVYEDCKLARITILENDARNKIYEFIVQNPGTNFSSLIKTLKLTKTGLVFFD